MQKFGEQTLGYDGLTIGFVVHDNGDVQPAEWTALKPTPRVTGSAIAGGMNVRQALRGLKAVLAVADGDDFAPALVVLRDHLRRQASFALEQARKAA